MLPVLGNDFIASKMQVTALMALINMYADMALWAKTSYIQLQLYAHMQPEPKWI